MSSSRWHSSTTQANSSPQSKNCLNQLGTQAKRADDNKSGLNKPVQRKSCSLRWQARILFCSAITTLATVLYATAATILLRSLENVEIEDTYQNVEGFLDTFAQSQADFSLRVTDWAMWDDTYQFVQDSNREYIEVNITPESIQNVQINAAVFLNSKNHIVYSAEFDLTTNQKIGIPKTLNQYIASHQHLLQHSNVNSSISGVVALPQGPMLIASRPVINSKGEEPIRGTLIFGRYLDTTKIATLAKKSRLNLTLHSLSQTLPPDFQIALASLSPTQRVFIRPLSDRLIAGYILLTDIDNKPVAILRTDKSRTIYQQGVNSLHYLLVLLVLIGFIFTGVTLPLLDRLILLRFERQEREERYRAVVTQAFEGIFLVDAQSKIILEANVALQALLDYSENEILQLTLYDIIVGDREQIDTDLQQILAKDHNVTREYKYQRQDGSLVDVEASAIQIFYNEKDAFCIVVRNITDRKKVEIALRESEQRLSWQASHDSLTGLVNRREFEQCLVNALNSAKNKGINHVLCYLDVDQFKIINDTCGHVAGDHLLRQVSTLFQNRLRKTDILARLGGDEFGIIFYQCSLEQATRITEALRQQLNDFPFVWKEKVFSVSASIGLVAINADTPDLGSVLSAADAACYAAKNKGRNRINVYRQNDREIAQQRGEMQWVSQIPKALEENRFCLFYQEIASLIGENHQQHYEILLRLKDENGQIVPPMAFIPAAERYNLMHLIDRWVISTLFAHLARSQAEENTIYAVNLSGASINDDSFVDFVQAQFAYYQIPPSSICFEITETLAIANLSQAVGFIQKLKNLGCYFALDDFGSGMSSFAYLKSLPVDYLKIDGSLVKDIVQDAIAYSMVEAISRIATVMELQTIAEFVENEAIQEKLRKLPVDYAQGYGIAKPKPLIDSRGQG
ncbi:EAL domain-containing protein [Chroogloeocystis siderophila]|uniref:Bifunctional diguanylate cyclase/phosphodiesterase n=1 Tax=Chroogloeocystis siderophila 5.2 s.c.1 TaxID=247279 RepID=A0A1U7HV85_9CHRO|nr:EAL domain-containing protein [Chroogloeocystis siderophila]OKH27481.1 bifunctional diguanylate cyclase/phosphodiesterase [Chroogloeocystis siderophila 5.2 s.c.1]